jgi:hypothetical protein
MENTLERLGGLQCHPWSWGRCGRPESGEAGGALDRGIGGRGPVAHLRSVRAQSWGRGCPSDGARRWLTAPPAAARGSGEGGGGGTDGNVRPDEVLQVLGELLTRAVAKRRARRRLARRRPRLARWSGGSGVGRCEEERRALK